MEDHREEFFAAVHQVWGKSQQRIKVLVQGESTTSSSQMVGKAISELMHREDATCDLISCSPGQHDLLLQCVRSPELPYLQGTRAAAALKSAANTGAPYRVNPFQGREATAPSVIRKIREVQRWEEAPPEGGAITPKDVHMKPFRSKSELNPSLHSRVIDRPRGPDGLPSGHADFDGGHPSLREDFVDGIAVVEVLTASLGPKVV